MKRQIKKPGGAFGLTFAFAIMVMANAQATVPSVINFQGKLLDTNNNPRNGTYDMTFRICDTPASSCASPLWSENQPTVSVSNGVFSVQLGAATPVTSSVFSASEAYLEIQIGSEVASTRERLVTSPYAFRASVADDVSAGSGNYIQNTNSLQSGATFYVSSGTVNGQLRVGGVLVAGSGAKQITDATGSLDATKLTGTLPSAQLSGTYSNALTLNNAGNAFTGSGAGLTNVTAAVLSPGSTDYIQNRNTLQANSTFYVSSGTVSGSLAAGGAVTLGGVAGTSDVTIQSNLIVNGAGPHIFTGNVRVNGNNLLDSGGTSRVTLGSNVLLNGNLGVSNGNTRLSISTSVAFVGATNGDNYIAYPFTAGGNITAKDVVIISGANAVDRTTTASNVNVLGIAVNTATAGNTVYVAVSGIVTGVTALTAVTAGNRVCTSTTAGQIIACGSGNQDDGKSFGKALTSPGAGATGTVVLWGN